MVNKTFSKINLTMQQQIIICTNTYEQQLVNIVFTINIALFAQRINLSISPPLLHCSCVCVCFCSW